MKRPDAPYLQPLPTSSSTPLPSTLASSSALNSSSQGPTAEKRSSSSKSIVVIPKRGAKKKAAAKSPVPSQKALEGVSFSVKESFTDKIDSKEQQSEHKSDDIGADVITERLRSLLISDMPALSATAQTDDVSDGDEDTFALTAPLRQEDINMLLSRFGRLWTLLSSLTSERTIRWMRGEAEPELLLPSADDRNLNNGDDEEDDVAMIFPSVDSISVAATRKAALIRLLEPSVTHFEDLLKASIAPGVC